LSELRSPLNSSGVPNFTFLAKGACMACSGVARNTSMGVRNSGGDLSLNLGGPGLRPPLSLSQSSFLPFSLVDSPGGLNRARSPAAKHFDANYTDTVKQPYKIHIDV